MRPAPVILVAAALALAVSGAAVAQTAQRFPDVPPEHEAFEAVDWAAEAGMTAGYTDGTFRPEVPLSKSHALVFMERFYDQILQAEQSEDFTRGDMMKLLHSMAPNPAVATTRDGKGTFELTGQGSAATRPVDLSFGIWDVTYRVTGNADRPFEVATLEEDYFEGERIDDHRNIRVKSLWTDDPAEWHQIGLVGSSKPHSERGAPTDTLLHYAYRTWFEVEAELDASWSIVLTKRPWPPAASDDPDRIVVWDDGSRGVTFGPFDFAEGAWRWEMLIWGERRADGVRIRLVAPGPDNVTLAGYDTYTPLAGHGSGGFYLGPADHSLFRPRAGPKYVTVEATPTRPHWVLVLTREADN